MARWSFGRWARSVRRPGGHDRYPGRGVHQHVRLTLRGLQSDQLSREPVVRDVYSFGRQSGAGPSPLGGLRHQRPDHGATFRRGGPVAARPGGATAGPRLLPVVAALAVRAPARYAAAHLPPVVVARPTAVRTAWLTDPGIRRAYLGSSRLSSAAIARGLKNFGAPLGPAQSVGDDLVAQPFAGAVLEHKRGSDDVHAADIASLLQSTGIVVVPRAARRLASPPALPPTTPPTTAQPTTVVPFLLTLGGALGAYALIVFWLWRRRRPGGVRSAVAG